MAKKKVIIMGAAGRDFHNFNVYFRNNPEYEVVAFTAAQLPEISGRIYPPELAGPNYPNGIPIYDEKELPELIKKHNVDIAVLAYSDLSFEYIMDRASIVNAAGASFMLLGPKDTMIETEKPLIIVTATRTGAGKSTVSRKLGKILSKKGKKIVAIRHPMPYGDLSKQIVQRFATYEDLDKHKVTFEEREEYEHWIDNGFVIYAGVDYEKILRQAEQEADVVIWDGGNNDWSFYKSKKQLYITVADALRPGHELTYWPGSVNVRLADLVIINKVLEACDDDVDEVEENVRAVNPGAEILYGVSYITVDKPELVKSKKVLVVEDGPTVTHGEMAYAAGYRAAIKYQAEEIVDPRPFAVGDLREAYEKYPHMAEVVPTLGYSDREKAELEETIRRAVNEGGVEAIIAGTPIDLGRLIKVDVPIVRVQYELREIGDRSLEQIIDEFLAKI